MSPALRRRDAEDSSHYPFYELDVVRSPSGNLDRN
jgi:hypothetical protein